MQHGGHITKDLLGPRGVPVGGGGVGPYLSRVLDLTSTDLEWLFPLDAGVAVDATGQVADGTVYNATKAAGIGDGRSGLYCNGTSAYIDIFSAALASALNPAAGTLMVWCNYAGGQNGYAASISIDAQNYLIIHRATTGWQVLHEGAGTVVALGTAHPQTGVWQSCITTYDTDTSTLWIYINGAPFGSVGGLGTLTGAPVKAAIGRWAGSAVLYVPGVFAYAAYWSRVLDFDEIRAIGNPDNLHVETPRYWYLNKVFTADYSAFGALLYFANAGELCHITRRGTGHVGNTADLRNYRSTDAGANWTDAQIVDNAGVDDRGVAGGVVSGTDTGLAAIAQADTGGATTSATQIDVYRSTDQGASWSLADSVVPIAGNDYFLPYGPLVQLPSGKLQLYYITLDWTPAGVYGVSVIESADDGANWSDGGAKLPNPNNEPAVCWLSGADDDHSVMVAVSRTSGKLRQYSTSDGGANWAYDGELPFSAGANDVSPWLLLVDGTVHLFYADRADKWIKHVTASAAAVAGDVNAWGSTENVSSFSGTTGDGNAGYPSVVWTGTQLLLTYYNNEFIDANVLFGVIP